LTKTGAIIDTAGNVRKMVFAAGDSELKVLQHAVGGYIESPSIIRGDKFDNFVLFVNEEGKIAGLDPNRKATRWAGYEGHDIICGDVVILGPVVQGNTRGLTDAEFQAIKDSVS
jgi:hypothetical protein